MKVWVVYGYNETYKMWDELDYSQKFRNVRYFMNPNSRRVKTAREHGFTKFIYIRKAKQAMWCFRIIPYNSARKLFYLFESGSSFKEIS
jgi:hypothetical protein